MQPGKKTSEQARVYLFFSARGCAWDVTRCSNFLHELPHNDGLGAGIVSQINLSSSMLLFFFFLSEYFMTTTEMKLGLIPIQDFSTLRTELRLLGNNSIRELHPHPVPVLFKILGNQM